MIDKSNKNNGGELRSRKRYT